jgi:hypothetical protein
VSFGDLAAQDQAYAGAAGLGGEERDEKIRRVGEAGAFVLAIGKANGAPRPTRCK